MKTNKKYYESADNFFKELGKDPEVSFYCERNEAKPKIEKWLGCEAMRQKGH